MTQPEQQSKVLELPVANPPLANRVVMSRLGAEQAYALPPDQADPCIVWAIGAKHPIINGLYIKRMYVLPGVGISVYAAAENGSVGVRTLIPWQYVRCPEEIMDAQTFVDEIAAEEEPDEDDEEEVDEKEVPGRPVAVETLQQMPPIPNGG